MRYNNKKGDFLIIPIIFLLTVFIFPNFLVFDWMGTGIHIVKSRKIFMYLSISLIIWSNSKLKTVMPSRLLISFYALPIELFLSLWFCQSLSHFFTFITFILIAFLVYYYFLKKYVLINTSWSIKKKSIVAARMLCFIISIFLILPSFCGGIAYYSRIHEFNTTITGETTISTNVKYFDDILQKVDCWDQANYKERVELLTDILEYENDYYSVETTTLKIDELSPGVLGSFSISENKITLDVSIISGPFEAAISVLLHEFFHKMQNVILLKTEDSSLNYNDIPLLDHIDTWRNEQQHYINGYKDYEGYANQKLEQDANAWANYEIMRLFEPQYTFNQNNH